MYRSYLYKTFKQGEIVLSLMIRGCSVPSFENRDKNFRRNRHHLIFLYFTVYIASCTSGEVIMRELLSSKRFENLPPTFQFHIALLLHLEASTIMYIYICRYSSL